VWKRFVVPARVDLAKVVANLAAVVAVTGEEPRAVEGHEIEVHDLSRRPQPAGPASRWARPAARPARPAPPASSRSR